MRAADPPPPGFYAPDPYSGRWFWVGVALAPLAIIIGVIMAKMGYGADG